MEGDPGLRDRGQEDIMWLIHKYLGSVGGGNLDLRSHFSSAATRFLASYSWPGNVRQLEKLICNHPDIVDLLTSGRRVELHHLEQALCLGEGIVARDNYPSGEVSLFSLRAGLTMAEVRGRLDAIKTWYTRRELALHGGNKSETSRSLQISRSNLDALLKVSPA